MGFGSMLFGDPERKRREKREVELDNDYYLRAKAYNKAKTEEKIRIATLKGKAAAQKEAGKKPFYQKVIGVGMALGKDVMKGAGNTNPNVFFNFDQPKTTRRKVRKRRKKK